ncbi:MAG TPA: GNAT family N-acetyltransferase [Myxococcaceae bacterium]|nr:GNAT family N-acetyltransferase [Myxococcaceae bacterium]
MSQSLPTQLKVLRSISDVPEAAWNALVDDEAAPFLEWAWLEALEDSGSVGPSSGWEPRHLTIWRGHRLVAAAPAYRKTDSSGEFVFDFSWANASERAGVPYYPKLIVAAPLTPATGRRFLVAPGEDVRARTLELARGALELAREERLSSVHLLFPMEEEARAVEPLGFAVRHGVQYHFLNEGYRAPEDVLERFTSKRRNQLKRERRAPAEQGLTLRVLRGDALAEADPRETFRLYASTVDKFAWGRRYLNTRFFIRVLERFRHRVELVQALAGERVVAGAFNLSSDRVLYGRYWGCFEEHPFLHFNVCLYAGMDEVVRRGLLRFEPGAGGEHKLVRGFTPSLTYSAHALFHRGLDRAVREYLAHERAAIEAGLPAWRAETGFKD